MCQSPLICVHSVHEQLGLGQPPDGLFQSNWNSHNLRGETWHPKSLLNPLGNLLEDLNAQRNQKDERRKRGEKKEEQTDCHISPYFLQKLFLTEEDDVAFHQLTSCFCFCNFRIALGHDSALKPSTDRHELNELSSKCSNSWMFHDVSWHFSFAQQRSTKYIFSHTTVGLFVVQSESRIRCNCGYRFISFNYI